MATPSRPCGSTKGKKGQGWALDVVTRAKPPAGRLAAVMRAMELLLSIQRRIRYWRRLAGCGLLGYRIRSETAEFGAALLMPVVVSGRSLPGGAMNACRAR